MKGLPWIFVRTYFVIVHNSAKFEHQKEIKNSLIAHSNVKATIVLLSMYVIDRADVQVYNYSQKEISQHCQFMLSFWLCMFTVQVHIVCQMSNVSRRPRKKTNWNSIIKKCNEVQQIMSKINSHLLHFCGK